MARIKPKNSITNKDEAAAEMSRLNAIDIQLTKWNIAEANAVAAVRARHLKIQREGNLLALKAEKALLIKELKAWSEADAVTWEKKTWETSAGRMGYRKSNPKVVLVKKIARNLKEALEFLNARMPAYVRQTPEIDREKILADERDGNLEVLKLDGCGLKVEQKDEFWIETNAIKDLEAAESKLRAA